jgi:hypothetical protein
VVRLHHDFTFEQDLDLTFLREVQALQSGPPTPCPQMISKGTNVHQRRRRKPRSRSVGLQTTLGGRCSARRRLAWPY